MKKLLAILALLAITLPVYASTVLFVPQGGTGANTLTGCLTGHGTSAISGSGTCSTFAWLFTKQAGGEQATTTTLGFFNGFLSLASSTNLALFTTSNLLSLGSSTLQTFTATNSTSTSATTTNLAITGLANPAGKFLAVDGAGSVIATTTSAGGVTSVSGTYPIKSTNGTTPVISLDFSTTTANSWSLLNQFNLASSSVLSAYFASFGRTSTTTINGTGDLFVVGSTTLQNFTGSNATTSQATTTNLAVSSLSKDSLVASNKFGGLVSTSTIGNQQLQNSSIVVTTASPLGGAGTISLGGTLGLTCTGCLTSAVTAVTATYPILATTGNTPALSFAFGTTTANAWSLLNNFNISSTTIASFGNAYFGITATSSFSGTGALFVIGSTTLQNFTAIAGTTTSATSTNLYTNNFLALASSTLQNATSSNFNVSANALSLTSSNVYVNGSTTAAFSFSTSTLDATYRNYGSGSTTLLLANYPEPRKLLGFYCVASSTTAFHFPALVRFKHDSTGNFTEANWCSTGGYTPVSTNASWTAFEGVDIEASSSANMIGRITITSVWQKLTP